MFEFEWPHTNVIAGYMSVFLVSVEFPSDLIIRSPAQAKHKPRFLGVKYHVTALLLARFSERASLEWW